ncbi:MAG: FAD:protein FMN transferase [Ilumatobacteraceae bacterium]
MNLALLEQRTWHRSAASVMGTTAELMFDGPPSLTPMAFQRLRELEQAWSRFIPNSELNRLHHQAGRWVKVSHELFVALRWCKRLHDETEGRFDPSIRTALEAWGYDRTFRDIDERGTAPTRCTPSPGLSGLELRRDDEAVRLAPGLRIDLGGIGKGLAADMLAGDLLFMGAHGAYVSVGGDIAVAGDTPYGGWDVPLHHPDTDLPFDFHCLDAGGLVMSTVRMRRWQRADGTPAHHLIDPRTGAPADTDVVAVAVAALSAARAEALAKAVIVSGSVEGARLLDSFGVAGWILTETDMIRVSSRV